MDDPIVDGMNAAANLLNTEPARNLLSPGTKEIGLTLGSIAGAFRFCVEENLEKLSPKWARQRQNRTLTLDEVRIVMPLLQAASMVSDAELQERWAALLESSVSEPDGVLPSFGQTLTQMSAKEARYVECLYRIEEQVVGRWELHELLAKFDGDDEDTKYLIIQDLERLGLLIRTQATSDEVTWEQMGLESEKPMLQPYPSNFGVQLFDRYSLSEYGRHFIKAVTPKS